MVPASKGFWTKQLKALDKQEKSIFNSFEIPVVCFEGKAQFVSDFLEQMPFKDFEALHKHQ